MSVSTRTSASRRGSPAGPAAAGSLPIAGVTAAPQERPGRGRSWRHKGWLRLISPIVVLALWQIISVAGIVSQQKLPSLTTLWSTAVRLITTTSPTYGTLQGAMATSLQRVTVGFAIGGGFAVILAVIAGLSRFGENAVDPVMQALRTLPLFGLIPVFIVWFGIGETPKITLIALGAAIPLYLNTFAGIRGVDGKLAERRAERSGQGRRDPRLPHDPQSGLRLVRDPPGRLGEAVGRRHRPAELHHAEGVAG